MEALTDFLKDSSPPEYDEAVIENIDESSDSRPEEDREVDELFSRAVEIGIEYGQVSISMLQRRLRVGYARAARLLDEMEVRGLVSNFEGSKPRQMLITREQFNEMFHGDGAEDDEE